MVISLQSTGKIWFHAQFYNFNKDSVQQDKRLHKDKWGSFGFFHPGEGNKAGLPDLSLPSFLPYIEPLGQLIRQCEAFKGITVVGGKQKVAMFADIA